VVFLDIVDYSKKSVSQEILIKERMNSCVSRAIEHISENDLIILDTGDGVALCFLGDPEDALFVALSLRDEFGHNHQSDRLPIPVRIGINLGPVKVVKDINRQLNILGDGINVAQRVMNFADPNQILVSRSFHEVISCLSQEYARLFHYLGLRKDKHIREHAVYEVKSLGTDRHRSDTDPAEEFDAIVSDEVIALAEEIKQSEPALTWKPEVLQTLQTHLAQYIGPLAGLLVKQAARTTSDINELCRLLTKHISDDREKMRFLNNVPLSRDASVSDVSLTSTDASVPDGVAGTMLSWDPAVLRRVETILALYLGPMAKLLVQREARKANNLSTLHHLLAEHLSTDEEKTHFLREVAQQ